MPKQVTVAANNRYCQARIYAGQYNQRLLSRAGAAEELGCISEDSLKKYELDLIRPPSDVVALMADAYNQPELRSWYCANECPLGKDRVAEIEPLPLERTSIRIHNSAKQLGTAINTMFEVIADGVIDESEWGEIERVKEILTMVKTNIEEVAVAIEKRENLKNIKNERRKQK